MNIYDGQNFKAIRRTVKVQTKLNQEHEGYKLHSDQEQVLRPKSKLVLSLISKPIDMHGS